MSKGELLFLPPIEKGGEVGNPLLNPPPLGGGGEKETPTLVLPLFEGEDRGGTSPSLRGEDMGHLPLFEGGGYGAPPPLRGGGYLFQNPPPPFGRGRIKVGEGRNLI